MPDDYALAMVGQLNALDDLHRRIGGRLLRPDHADFDATRAIFNATIDRRPAVIVLPETAEEVALAVRAARAAGLPIAVRGGGHAVAGHAVADGAMTIDLRRMRGVTVDSAARRARVEGGALWEDVDKATIPYGLATTGGTFWDTGVGGLTLSGGLGYLMGTAGLTCDNLVRATVVTADGSLVEAGPDGDPELLWALRGGGGNFGVVTEFEFRLHPIDDWQVGEFRAPIERGAEALVDLGAFARQMPDEIVIFSEGPASEQPPADDGSAQGPFDRISATLMFQGTPDAAERAFAPLLASPHWRGKTRASTYEAIQSDGVLPFGLRHYWKGHFVRQLDQAAGEAIVAAMTSRPADPSFILLEAMNGRARVEPDDGGAAFGQREARWNVSAIAIWEDPADDDRQIAWARRAAEGLAPSSYSGAGYGNYAPVDESSDRVRAGFGPERFGRLQAVKLRYDPENVFRFNLNIPPAQTSR
jgi:FAD/FMN-containing dehydrogenase